MPKNFRFNAALYRPSHLIPLTMRLVPNSFGSTVYSALIVVFFSLFSNLVFAKQSHDLTVRYYQEHGNQLSIQDFLDNPNLLERFGQHTGTFNKEHVTHWFYVTWDKASVNAGDYYLEQLIPNNDYINTYVIFPDGQFEEHLAGGARPFTMRELSYRLPYAPISHAEYVLIKVVDPSNAPMPVNIVSKEQLNKQRAFDLSWYSAFVAIILALVIYNLFIFLFLRDISYFYYVCYLLSLGLLSLQMSGVGQQYLWPHLENSSQIIGMLVVTGANLFTILFADSFLQPQHKNPWLRKLTRFFAALIVLNYGLFFIPYFINWTLLLIQLLTVLIMPSVYVMVLVAFFRGDRSARLLALTYFLIFPGVGLSILRYNNLIPNTFFTEHFIEISIIVEAIFLSVGLADRINLLRQEKIASERKNFALQKQFVGELLASQEREKRMLSEILHDNIGHKLLLLKMAVTPSAENASLLNAKINDIIYSVRDLSHLTHPYLVERLGLKMALEGLIQQIEQGTQLTIHDRLIDSDLSQEQQILLYRIVQESLNNVIKHAHASECFVILAENDTYYSLTIKDNGSGFVPETTEGFGLKSIAERVNALRATYQINSSPAQGTTIIISNIPSQSKNADVCYESSKH